MNDIRSEVVPRIAASIRRPGSVKRSSSMDLKENRNIACLTPIAFHGTYLHAQQDSFSHRDFEPNLGQLAAAGDGLSLRSPIKSIQNRMKEMEKYDKTTFDPAKAVDMARDTLAKLLAARNMMAVSGRFGTFRAPIPWEKDKFINDKLWEWANTDGRDAKQTILFEIMNYAMNYSNAPQEGGGKKKNTNTRVKVLDK